MFAVRAVNNERCRELALRTWGLRASQWASFVLAVLLVSRATVHADSNTIEPAFEVPPAPMDAAPRHVLDLHSGFSTALQNKSLCPAGSGCVFQSGGGIGATLERRWPQGLGVIGGYDAWFLDTDSVYELGVQQALRAGGRYTLPSDVLWHPVIELSLGGMGYGDTFRIATIGVLLQGFAGCEVELSERFGLLAGFGLRAFSHREFRTQRDRVLRGEKGLFSESFFVQIGLTVM